MITKEEIQEIIHQHHINLGRKGGSAKSEKKTIACRLNSKKPRPNGRKPRRPRK